MNKAANYSFSKCNANFVWICCQCADASHSIALTFFNYNSFAIENKLIFAPIVRISADTIRFAPDAIVAKCNRNIAQHLVSASEMCHMHFGAICAINTIAKNCVNFFIFAYPVRMSCAHHSQVPTSNERRRRIAQNASGRKFLCRFVHCAVRANTENGAKTVKEIFVLDNETHTRCGSFRVFAIFGCSENSVGTGRMPKRASLVHTHSFTTSKCNSQLTYTHTNVNVVHFYSSIRRRRSADARLSLRHSIALEDEPKGFRADSEKKKEKRNIESTLNFSFLFVLPDVDAPSIWSLIAISFLSSFRCLSWHFADGALLFQMAAVCSIASIVLSDGFSYLCDWLRRRWKWLKKG